MAMSSATDELRRMLDERGVEWKNETAFMQGQEHLMTTWKSMDGKTVAYSEFEYPHMKKLRIYDCTPEQAIAATLGDVPYLPYFWTHDGTLHVELPRLPESISVRLPDQRDREVRSARTWQYTLGAGTCKEVYLLMATDIGDGREEVLGAYATEEAAMAAINENQFGYALHHVCKLEVDE